MARMLSWSEQPLVRAYDAALLDLDGVVYLGGAAVAGSPEAIAAVRDAGMAVGFVTNNASRAPDVVAHHLNSLGIAASADEVITSSMAVARLLSEKLTPGARVLVVGAEALSDEVAAAGFTVVTSADDVPAAVVQGLATTTTWADLGEATVAVRNGALWVAANVDRTLPTTRGLLPGNGALVDVVAKVTGAVPIVAGKPEPPLHSESVRRTGARHPIVVGDRLDTDIEGANRVGADSLLVFTGVTHPAELLAAPEELRPSYLAADLGGLLVAQPRVVGSATDWRCGRWAVTTDGVLSAQPRAGTGEDDGLDSLRAIVSAAWSGTSRVSAGDDEAAAELRRLGLAG
jgi:glycerol-1-phosphatase